VIRGRLADETARLVAERIPFVLATVVRARRPTSVSPGDAAIVLPDGTVTGFVGGVCAESSVRLHAMRALETGEALLLRLVPDEGFDADSSDDAVVEHNPCLSGGVLEIFLEPELPAPRIVVAGSAPIALALREIAGAAGYEIGVGDVNMGDAAVVVACHGSGSEERVLAQALRAGVPYVALVASRKRGEAVRETLDVPEELRGRLRTPAGLDIGARTPAEIAISILAELVSVSHAVPRVPGAATAVDPVCSMEVPLSERTVSLETAGERVHFCSERCRDAYAQQHAGPH
jgi:xanthine dehydrogenase accessory factor